MNLSSNDEIMNEMLGEFGVEYNAPCYISINDFSGFLASNKNGRPGYAAYTDNGELLLIQDNLMGRRQIILTGETVTSVESRKMLLLPQQYIQIKGIQDGKKYFYKIYLPLKDTGKFPLQAENSDILLRFITSLRS